MSEATTAATARPKVERFNYIGERGLFRIRRVGVGDIAKCKDENIASEFVHCVNSHDALLAVAKEMRNALATAVKDKLIWAAPEMMARADTAIAAAEARTA